jgi:sporulation protein YlmC with PRC-barrel domain
LPGYVGGCTSLTRVSVTTSRRIAVAETTPFTIGAEVSCSDGACGVVSRVIVDPVARAVTHLVVEPKHRLDLAKLVPVGLVDASGDQVRLSCTTAEFEQFDDAEESQFIPGAGGVPAYGPDQALSWPYYGLGPGVGGFGSEIGPMEVVYDTTPAGEVEVRRGEHVHATDGAIGRVQGLVVDRKSRQVTHVLLQEGHLWGKKEVAIPIGAVAKVDPDDGIHLSITKRQVQDLPPVDIEHPAG